MRPSANYLLTKRIFIDSYAEDIQRSILYSFPIIAYISKMNDFLLRKDRQTMLQYARNGTNSMDIG